MSKAANKVDGVVAVLGGRRRRPRLPRPSQSSFIGSSQQQKRKRSSVPTDNTAGAEFVASSTAKTTSNFLSGTGDAIAGSHQPHSFIMPLSSLDSQHTLPETLGSSLEEDEEGVNNGGKNGPGYGRFEGANGGGDGDEEEDDEEVGEGNDDEGEQDDGKNPKPCCSCAIGVLVHGIVTSRRDCRIFRFFVCCNSETLWRL